MRSKSVAAAMEEEEEKYDRGSVVRESNLAPADIGMEEEEEEEAGAEGDDAK